MDRLIEGNRAHQMRLDKSPWNLRKLRIKLTKHTVWILFSLFTGFTFVAFFTPATELISRILTMQLGPWETFWILFYGFATYGNAGWMREQVCIYMCPYARFQSAMFDDDTLVVSYDQQRGEPRGSRRASIDHRREGMGDCINCSICVQVCPTGIDIRDGMQYQCISCSACIDACDDVMDKMGYPKGLIRYTTQNTLQGKESRIIRPRIIIYSIMLIGIISIFISLMSQRIPIGLDVIRDRNQLYREVDGLIENVYTLKVINMDQHTHAYSISIHGIDDMQMKMGNGEIVVNSGQVLDLPVRIRVDEAKLPSRSSNVYFTITATDNPELTTTEPAKFLGPLQ